MSNVTVYDELDMAVEAMLADAPRAPRSEDAEMAMLCDIAADLRHLPRPEFKASLMTGLLAEAALLALPARPRTAAAEDDFLPTLTGQGASTYPVQRMNFVASLALHAAAVALLATSGIWVMDQQVERPHAHVVSTLIFDGYPLPPAPQEAAGGGGGGDRDILEASKGSLPRSAMEQFTPPTVIVRNLDPKLAVQATVVAPPDIKLPQSAQMGDPLSGIVGPPSNGTGSAGGIGSGDGGGVGLGTGPGVGTGRGGGWGGGLHRVGGSVSAPRVLYNPDPEYSEEARKAKYQGSVVLWTVIGPDGRVRDVRVARSLGMGLDEKAMAAVRTWKFEPAMKDGRPVAVQVNVEVNFRLY
jgi:periplasmic protein TonB